MRLSKIIADLEEIAPPRLAEEGDRIGLQVGDTSSDITNIFVTLDPDKAAVDHASGAEKSLLICHHPLIYTPVSSLAAGDYVADRIIKLITCGTALYIMHTNFDTVNGGVNDILASRLGVNVTGHLETHYIEKRLKIVVFVPKDSLDDVRNAMAEAGAGIIGNYKYCSFRVEGIGSFLPVDSARPYIGKKGSLEEIDEYRLEMVVPEKAASSVINAMISAHPYEEVAYDLYSLENQPERFGYGRVGELDEPLTLEYFSRRVETALGAKHIRKTGNPGMDVKTVALCSGSGRKFISSAIAAGADVYVTADVPYHDMQDAAGMGLAIIDAGHAETESPAMEDLARCLKQKYAESHVSIEFID